MGLIAVVEADLRAISAEARRRYPAVKDAAEHAILKVPDSTPEFRDSVASMHGTRCL